MIKHLLKKDGKFYKANLHTHSTVSDGVFTPSELKKLYQEKGYSILAISDHNIIKSHQELTDENFVAITSGEFGVVLSDGLPLSYGNSKIFHLNFFAKDPSNDSSIFFGKDSQKEYSLEYINNLIKTATNDGFLISYNHPVWSQQNYTDYSNLKGLWAVEVYNEDCVLDGYYDTTVPLDDLLRNNQNVFPISTDDAHWLNACFGGWVMVKSDKLTYKNVINALENGDFYASSGPMIEEIYIEDNVVKVKTSNVNEIILSSDRRFSKRVSSNNSSINFAEFDLTKFLETSKLLKTEIGKNSYIRITAKDNQGKCAYSRAYFIDELI